MIRDYKTTFPNNERIGYRYFRKIFDAIASYNSKAKTLVYCVSGVLLCDSLLYLLRIFLVIENESIGAKMINYLKGYMKKVSISC